MRGEASRRQGARRARNTSLAVGAVLALGACKGKYIRGATQEPELTAEAQELVTQYVFKI